MNIYPFSPRLLLALNLAIASALVATVVKAESSHQHPSDNSVTARSQAIANLIDLTLDRQNLLKSALNRAIAAKEHCGGDAELAGRKPLQPKSCKVPVDNSNPQPSPIVNPTPSLDSDKPSHQPSRIIGQLRRSLPKR